MGDLATEHDDKDEEAEDGAEDNVDNADEEAALVLEQVLSLGPGPITCRTNKSDVQAAASKHKGEVGCADTNSVWHTSDQQLTMYLPVWTQTTHCKYRE